MMLQCEFLRTGIKPMTKATKTRGKEKLQIYKGN